MADKGSEYQKRADGSATVFSVTPAQAPKFMFLVVFGAVVTLIGLASLSSGFGIVFLAMGGFALWYGWARDLRPKEHRVPSSFRVSADAIEANGRTFRKDDIHRLLLRNGVTDKELLETYTASASAAAGMAYRARVARLANALTVESGGKSTMLAGGMDETTAYGLMHEVSRILGFK